MLVVESKWREKLTPAARELFDDVNLQRLLGASAHIRLIGDIFLDIAEHGEDAEAMGQTAAGIAAHFTETRGESSQAISNAIRQMSRMFGGESREAFAASVRQGVAAYREKAEKDLEKIRALLWTVLEDKRRLLLFDYSSTVAAAAALGRDHGVRFHCYIPESRALDGGRPYVRPFLEAGHSVHFIPDSAMYHYIRRCDAALIGSETFYPDGTCFNTVGSEMAACLCRQFHVPFYVPTPLLKVDIRALEGHRKKPIIDDHKNRMAGDWNEEEREGADFVCPELVPVPPEYITAYITEEGILPPGAMYPASLAYQKKLEGGVCG